jgi:transcription antitermination factor NusG
MDVIESTERSTDAIPWYAVQVKTTHEKRVASLLDYGRFEWFLPVYESKRLWSDRIKRVQLPLFPGYVFCRFGPSGRVSILKTPSVMRIVGVGYTPLPIPEQEIAAIQRIVKSGLDVLPHPFLKTGEWVRIRGGALNGLEGLIVDLRHRDRLIVSVNLLQRSVAVEIDSAWVVPTQSPLKASPKTLSASAGVAASRHP